MVKENQRVDAGAVLVAIDTADYEVALERARAELANAEADAEAARAAVPITSTTATSNVTSAKGGVDQTTAAAEQAHRLDHGYTHLVRERLMPLMPLATELLTFVDRHRGLEIRESLRTRQTNFMSVACEPADDLAAFLAAARFPRHALVVAPNEPRIRPCFQKGVVDPGVLKSAVADACSRSRDGKEIGRAHV